MNKDNVNVVDVTKSIKRGTQKQQQNHVNRQFRTSNQQKQTSFEGTGTPDGRFCSFTPLTTGPRRSPSLARLAWLPTAKEIETIRYI
jgi:hypothetical protein